ncbi:hypothetical protein DSUL_20484 [Desulfovibrionales bacterium]
MASIAAAGDIYRSFLAVSPANNCKTILIAGGMHVFIFVV